jgi:hypothetical protein
MWRIALASVLLVTGHNPQTEPIPPAPPEEQAPPSPERPTQPIPKNVASALTRINDNPFVLHNDYTPAVEELIAIGEPALEPTLTLILSDDRDTVEHAATAVGNILATMHGWVRGQGFANPEEEMLWTRTADKLFEDTRPYRRFCYAPLHVRAAFVVRVKKWIASRRA